MVDNFLKLSNACACTVRAAEIFSSLCLLIFQIFIDNFNIVCYNYNCNFTKFTVHSDTKKQPGDLHESVSLMPAFRQSIRTVSAAAGMRSCKKCL